MNLRIADVRGLAQALDRLTIWLRRQSPATVSSSTITTLDRLHTEGPLRISELAEREAMTQPGVTILVNRLAQAGHAERVPDPTDGRAALVRITPAGLAVLEQRHADRARVLRERLAELSESDQQLLSAALPAIERLLATGAPTSDLRRERRVEPSVTYRRKQRS